MIYRFLMLSDENDFFKREIKIDSSATFKQLNDCIITDAKYDPTELTTFYICDDEWNKGTEITLVDMDMGSEYDSYLMDEVQLGELIEDKGQKLLFVFDMLSERAFFLELVGIIPKENLEAPIISLREGEAPQQTSDIETASMRSAQASKAYDLDDDLFNNEDYSIDELDPDGFSYDQNDLY